MKNRWDRIQRKLVTTVGADCLRDHITDPNVACQVVTSHHYRSNEDWNNIGKKVL